MHVPICLKETIYVGISVRYVILQYIMLSELYRQWIADKNPQKIIPSPRKIIPKLQFIADKWQPLAIDWSDIF